MDNFLWRSTETTDSFIYSRASKKRVGTFPIAQQEISRQYFCCQDISCWATGNIPTMLFCCRDISCCQKLCRDISCCSTGNIPTAFFAVGIFPVVQFCRDISPWHNVGIFPIGCVGTSTFPQNNGVHTIYHALFSNVFILTIYITVFVTRGRHFGAQESV
jgi:hypothetical protein